MESPPRGVTAWLALWRVTRDVERIAHEDIASSGLGLTDFAVLEALLHRGPQRVNAIAHRVMLTSGSMTTAVDRLAKRGLVRRTTHAPDGRVRMVELTAEGHALIESDFATHAETMERVFQALGEQERSQLLSLLLKLRRGVRVAAPPAVATDLPAAATPATGARGSRHLRRSGTDEQGPSK
ncbi:MAG: MarR family winged helix-turn-helix transcriptional regulator [Thermoleophilia bacterium]